MSYVLTLVAAREAVTLTQSTIDRVREAVGGGRTPVILSPGEAADIPGLSADTLEDGRAALEGAPVDLLLARERGRRKRLLVADMDSTIVTGETLDELAAMAGVGEQVAAITRRSMNGEIDFREALRARVAMLKGLDLSALQATWQGVKLTPGARTLVATMRAHGATTALVSGGFSYFTERVAALCGFATHHANVLLDDGARLTGEVARPILDRDAKLATLRTLSRAAGFSLGVVHGGGRWCQRPGHVEGGRGRHSVPRHTGGCGRGRQPRRSCRSACLAVRPGLHDRNVTRRALGLGPIVICIGRTRSQAQPIQIKIIGNI